jgi:peptidoglycan/xylan/chitin deacetylase (PgdA/CDA1 family)
LIGSLVQRLKNSFSNKAIVLVYHRVADLESDVWRLAVDRHNFEQHLAVLKNNWQVLSLPELIDDLQQNKIKDRSIAITFDDGYIDNYLNAKPLLEKYQVPATFFISSGNLNSSTEFWWDELEYIFLYTYVLPQILTIQIGDSLIYFDLEEENVLTQDHSILHKMWNALVHNPPTLRSKLYLKVWEAFMTLSIEEKQECLNQIKIWAGKSYPMRNNYHSMNIEQLKEISSNNLFNIGGHTISHPDLAILQVDKLNHEIRGNKAFLENIISKNLDFFAYPYGRNNGGTELVTAQSGYIAAFTTDPKLILKNSPIYKLGRFHVGNWDGDTFKKFLEKLIKDN